MAEKKRHLKTILLSVVFLLAGIVLLAVAVERVKSGWYRANYKIRPGRREGFAILLPVLLILAGCFNLYRGIKGKGFQTDISNIFSSYGDGSLYACPHCGGKLKEGQIICPTCGKKVY